MKKYRVWKTFPVSAGTWHTEEFIVEADELQIDSQGRINLVRHTAMSEYPIQSFSKEYSIIEITNQQ